MSAGTRDVVLITGITGYGKSTWLEKFLVKFPRVFIFDPFRAIPAEYVTGDELINRFDNGAYKDAPSFRIGVSAIPDLSVCGSIAYLVGHCVFIIEECGYAFRKGEEIPEWLAEGIFLGRHQYLSLVFTAQRAISIPISLRSQANRAISFAQSEPADVKWWREKLGERSEELLEIPQFECLDYERGILGKTVSRYRITPVGK